MQTKLCRYEKQVVQIVGCTRAEALALLITTIQDPTLCTRKRKAVLEERSAGEANSGRVAEKKGGEEGRKVGRSESTCSKP